MTIPNSVLDLFTEASKISYEHPKNLEEFESLNDDEIFTGYLYAKYDFGELDHLIELSIIKM